MYGESKKHFTGYNMNQPKVSLVMPVYNGEGFVRESIDSMLNQSFTDFEFIIFNDGSTDKTREILESYTDPRIQIFHQNNLGIAQTLNKGINLAKGEYIARMDADDISQPDRLAQQVNWLNDNLDHCAVATRIQLIDINGNDVGGWSSDENTTTSEEIRKFLPSVNCLAHSSVMIRADIIRKYLYDPKQWHSEDYDLWLRITSDGLKISKIKETLLKLRLHKDSFTKITYGKLGMLKDTKMKGNYIRSRILHTKNITWFDLRVFKQFICEIISFYFTKFLLNEHKNKC